MFVFCQEKVSKNMKFKEFFSEKSIITELTQKTLDKLPKNLSDLLTNKKLPFEKIFDGKLRIIESFKSQSEYGEQIKNLLGNDFQIDFEKWVGHKLTDSEKKNPIRIGKLLQKKKQDIIKILKEYEKNPPDERMLLNFNPVLVQQNMLENIDRLLKISDLQKAHSSTSKSQYTIIYSRVPVDVARMSDFSWRSCHSEGGDYFNCALADAMLNAGIAYLVDSQQLIDAAGGNDKIDEFLQKGEIFSDSGRNVKGIEPLARIRIRCVLDEQGNQLAVPSLKIYKSGKISGIDSEFKNLVKEWAKRQDSKQFNWTDTLTLKGGSYQDLMYDIKTMIYEIWGANISYDSAMDEEDFEDEESEDQDHDEEQFWDNVREEIDLERIYRDALGQNYDYLFDIDLNLYDGSLRIEYNIDDDFINYLENKEKIENKIVSNVYKVGNTSYPVDIIYSLNGRKDVRFRVEHQFDLYNFDHDVESDYFNYSGMRSYCVNHIQKIIETYIKTFIPNDEIELMYYLNKAIAEHYNVSYQEVSEDEIEYLASWQNAEDFYTGILPNFPYEFEPRVYTYDFKISKEIENYLKDSSNFLMEYVYDTVNKKFDNLFEKLYVDLFVSKVMVPQPSSKKPSDGYSTRLGDNSYSLKDSLLIVVDAGIKKSQIDFKMRIPQSDLREIINKNLTKEYHDLVKYLYDELYEEIQDIKYFSDLQDFLEKRMKKDELKSQGQMELDLSSINRIMNNFDRYIYKFWTEGLGNMGTGGLANRSGSSSGQSSQSGFGMNTGAQTNKPATTKSSITGKPTSTLNVSDKDMDTMLSDPKTNFDEILKDPNNQKTVFGYISNSLMNPQYKNRTNLENLLKTNTKLSTAYNKFINNPVK